MPIVIDKDIPAFKILTGERIFVIGSISALCGFLVQSLFDYTFYNYRVMLMFWAVLAISMLYANIGALREE